VCSSDLGVVAMRMPGDLSTRVIPGGRPAGHDHFWDRAISRRSFIRGSAALTGMALAATALPVGVAGAAPASAAPPWPKPIPGGLDLSEFGGPLIHIYPPAPGQELITITDFNGAFGAAEIQGLGTDTDGATRAFDVDMRFMQGAYVGTDGRRAEGTFGFI